MHDRNSSGGRLPEVVRQLEDQARIAHSLVKTALASYRSSLHILDMTCQLRIAALNVFIKTEKNNQGNNVLAPISLEFMSLVSSYQTDTQQFGDLSTGFVRRLVEYVKDIRKYRQFVHGLGNLEGSVTDNSAAFYGRLRSMRAKQDILRGALEDQLSHVRRIYKQLQTVDRQLSHLSSVGEYAAQIAKIEASRLDNRDELLAAFDDIQLLLNHSLQELDSMRRRFLHADSIMKSLGWNL